MMWRSVVVRMDHEVDRVAEVRRQVRLGAGASLLLYRTADVGAARSPTHTRVEGEVSGHFYCSHAGLFGFL